MAKRLRALVEDATADDPTELAAIIHRALAKNPDVRFPDVRAFRAGLTQFAY